MTSISEWKIVASRSDAHPKHGWPLGQVLCRNLEEAEDFIRNSEFKDCYISDYDPDKIDPPKPLDFHDNGLYDEIEDYGRNVILTNNYDLDFDLDPAYNPKTGEIYRKTKWISKEEVKEMFPEKKGEE